MAAGTSEAQNHAATGGKFLLWLMARVMHVEIKRRAGSKPQVCRATVAAFLVTVVLKKPLITCQIRLQYLI